MEDDWADFEDFAASPPATADTSWNDDFDWDVPVCLFVEEAHCQ
jgi:hypothetical protein